MRRILLHLPARSLKLTFSAIIALAALVLVIPAEVRQAAGGSADAIQAGAESTHDVTIVDFAFDPSAITVTVGSTVKWTNMGSFTHSVTNDANASDRHNIDPGSVYTRTFTAPGSFTYHCSFHPFMTGTIVVVQPPAHVNITGPSDGAHGATFEFTATVSPITTTLPITYFWQATGQSPVTHAGAGLSDTIAFSWTPGITGAQWITVTAAGDERSPEGTHLLIIDPIKTYLPLILK